MMQKSLIVLAIIGAAAITGGAIGAIIIEESMHGTVTIQSSPGLSILDASCATVQTSLTFPSLEATMGSTSTLVVCLKNTGNQPFYILKTTANSVNYTSLPSGVSGDWTAAPLPGLVNPGQTLTVYLVLTNDGTAIAGTPTFTINFTAYGEITG